MEPNEFPPPIGKKKRTTLSLPADYLLEAQRIARRRNVSLSTVVTEALAEGLRTQRTVERSEEVLASYRKAFAGFSEEERMILDGFIMKPVGKKRR